MQMFELSEFGSLFRAPPPPPPILTAPDTKQDFLEASPYYDQKTVPVNTFKVKEPFKGKVVSCKRIVGPKVSFVC